MNWMSIFRRERCSGSVSGSTDGTIPVYVFVSHTAQPGGGELALARYLAGTNLDHVELVTLADGSVWDGLRKSGNVKFTIARSRLQRVPAIGDLIALRNALRHHRSSILVANSMRVALLLALVGGDREVVYWVRDGLNSSSVSKLGIWLTRVITVKRMSAFMVNSRWTATTVTEIAPPGAKIVVAYSPSGIQARDGFDKVGSKIETADSRGAGNKFDVRLLYLGRIAEWKGVHVALDALEVLNKEPSEYRFTLGIAGASLFGEDAYDRALRLRATEIGNVEFLGQVTQVPELIDDYDFLVHCSLLPEPFGQVVPQGMNRGVVVLATNLGGPREVIEDGVSGFLLAPGSSEDICSTILRLVRDPAEYAAVSANAVKRAAQFSDESTISHIDSVLTSFRGGVR